MFLFIATIFPENNFVGAYGKFLGSSNILLFGYLAYLTPFYIMWLLYAFYKNLKTEVFERIFAIFILFIAFAIIQSLLFSKGVFGNIFVNAMKPFIGNVGIILIILFLFTIASLILKLDIPKIKLPQKQILETKKEIKEASQIEDKIENKKDEKKENLNVEEYIKSRLETVHNVDELEDDTNIQINNVKEEKVKDIKEDVKELENKSENNPLEEIKEIENKEKPKIKEETKKENNKQEIEEKEVKEILEKIEKVETIDKKVQIVSELDENKELLKDIEKGKLAKPKDFSLPPLEFLKRPLKRETQVNEEEIDKKVKLLLDKLKNFKIQGDVVRTYTGPVVTTFEFKPLAHIKVSKILNLQDDLAMALKASTIRIQAPVPGKDVVGIEIPNNEIETIYLREILETELFKNSKAPLLIALGKDIVGKPFVTDLAKLPHLLIAGTTGSGKSVGINACLLYTSPSPRDGLLSRMPSSA
jgi:S-DNA-T family DNA segregation ATPase FtsK/SpoIIIE